MAPGALGDLPEGYRASGSWFSEVLRARLRGSAKGGGHGGAYLQGLLDETHEVP